MLDIKFIRENPDAVRENIKKKFQDAKLPLVDEVLDLDSKRRAAIAEADQLRSNRNTLSKQIGMLMGQAKKDPSKLEEAEAVKQQVKEQAEKSGLSVMLEDKQEEVAPGEVLSATDQGITITAVQSIVDSYGADLFFRVEGFTPPEGCAPEMFWDRDKVTIDGSTEFHSSMTGWFYDGTTRNEAGEWVYASNGQPVEFGNDKYQSAIYQWVTDDGSLEYQMKIRFRDSGERYWGKEFSIHFNGIGTGAEKGGIMEEPLVSGSWDLHWTLTGADNAENSVTITPNMEIGDSGLTLLEAEVGQKTIRAVYQSDHDWDGWKQLEMLSPGLYQICMKDGSAVRVVPTQENYARWEAERICEVTYETFDGILDVSALDSLAYDKGSEIGADGKRVHTFDYIPIS